MTPGAAETFLRALGSTKFDKSTLPWLTSQCPLARWRHQSGVDKHPSFGILTGKSKARCHCFSCGFGGSLDYLIGQLMLLSAGTDFKFDIRTATQAMEDEEQVFSLAPVEEQEQIAASVLMPYPESWWATFPPAVNCKPAMQYLFGHRAMTPAEVKEYDLRWDPNQQRVVFPIRGRDGKLYGARGRLITAGEPKYYIYKLAKTTNMQLWYGEHEVDFDQPVLVVESVFDRVAARRFYKNTLAPMSASVSQEQIKRIADGFCFVHLFDGDVAGARGSGVLRKSLPKAQHVVLQLPSGEDPGSMAAHELRQVISQALPLDA